MDTYNKIIKIITNKKKLTLNDYKLIFSESYGVMDKTILKEVISKKGFTLTDDIMRIIVRSPNIDARLQLAEKIQNYDQIPIDVLVEALKDKHFFIIKYYLTNKTLQNIKQLPKEIVDAALNNDIYDVKHQILWTRKDDQKTTQKEAEQHIIKEQKSAFIQMQLLRTDWTLGNNKKILKHIFSKQNGDILKALFKRKDYTFNNEEEFFKIQDKLDSLTLYSIINTIIENEHHPITPELISRIFNYSRSEKFLKEILKRKNVYFSDENIIKFIELFQSNRLQNMLFNSQHFYLNNNIISKIIQFICKPKTN